jgi:RNA polymerase sigma factor (sigma-70 family)
MRTYTKTARKKNMLSDEELLEKMELAKSGDADAILTVYTEMWDYFEAWYRTNYVAESFQLRQKLGDMKSEFYFHTLKVIETYDANMGSSVRTYFYCGFKNFLFRFFANDNSYSMYYNKTYGTTQTNINDPETGELIAGIQTNDLSVEEKMTIKQLKNNLRNKILKLKQSRQEILTDYLFEDLSISEIARKYGLTKEGVRQNIISSLKKLGLNSNIKKVKSNLTNYQKYQNKILLDAREKREKNKKQK